MTRKAPEPDLGRDPLPLPWEPDPGDVVTTMALGEEGDPDPIDCYLPWPPDFDEATTMALGEEGPPMDMDTDILLV